MSKKVLNGKVIKDKNDKTVVVLIKRRYSHPFFGKVVTYFGKYLLFLLSEHRGRFR